MAGGVNGQERRGSGKIIVTSMGRGSAIQGSPEALYAAGAYRDINGNLVVPIDAVQIVDNDGESELMPFPQADNLILVNRRAK